MRTYSTRLTITPWFIESFVSVSPVLTGYQDKTRSKFIVSRTKPIVNVSRVASALSRARKRLRYTIASNIDVSSDLSFWTYTFNNENLTTAKHESQAREYFRQFMKRFQRSTHFSLKYVAIAELQKKNGRNAWHFHVLYFNLPFFPHDEMSKYWRGGFVFVSSRRANIESFQHLIIYMSKYLSKDTDIGRSKKLFWGSRGLKKPIIQYNKSFDFTDWTLYSSLEVVALDKPQYFIKTYYNNYAIRNNTKVTTHRTIYLDR